MLKSYSNPPLLRVQLPLATLTLLERSADVYSQKPYTHALTPVFSIMLLD